MTYSATTTVELLRRTASSCPDHNAYVEGDQRLTFAQWDRAADGLATAWAELGVAKGDVVALILPSSIDYAICYQAAMRLGAITTGLNPRLGPHEIGGILDRTNPRIVVIDDAHRAIGDVPGALLRSALAPLYGKEPLPDQPVLAASDPVAIVWTSGTTGEPKGAVFTHCQLAAVSAGAGEMGHPFDRRLSASPFAHVAYMVHVWEEIEKVITTVIPPTPWKAAEAVGLMERERVTVGQGVPTQWRLMLDCPDFAAADLSSLRIAGTGASTVPPDLVREMQDRLGCAVVIGYTSTEAAITAGSVPGDPPELISTTVGRARPTVELQVVDEAGRPVSPGDVGWVRCRSGAVMQEYWHDPTTTASVLGIDGWLAIGDLGRLDERGYLTLLGRGSEMYIRGGYNVYPAEVERQLARHPAVRQVAVVGKPDPVLGEIGVAFVVPGTDEPVPGLPDLRSWCRAALADYKAPDRLVLVDTLPLTSMSKVDKRALAARAADLTDERQGA